MTYAVLSGGFNDGGATIVPELSQHHNISLTFSLSTDDGESIKYISRGIAHRTQLVAYAHLSSGSRSGPPLGWFSFFNDYCSTVRFGQHILSASIMQPLVAPTSHALGLQDRNCVPIYN